MKERNKTNKDRANLNNKSLTELQLFKDGSLAVDTDEYGNLIFTNPQSIDPQEYPHEAPEVREARFKAYRRQMAYGEMNFLTPKGKLQ